MQSSLERELKLEPPEGFELPPIKGEGLEVRVFTSIYYDTPDRSLAHAGITLRCRLESGVPRWQLKLPRGENARSEIEALGGPASPPEELLKVLKVHLRHGELERIATLRTRRAGIRVGGRGRAVADVTLDVVEVLNDGAATGQFSELEVELIDGDERDLKRLGRTLLRAGARRSDGRPKVMRVLGLEEEAAPARDAPTVERIRYLLGEQLRALEARDPGVRMDDDPEDLHKFRVATRRTRAIVRATHPILGDRLEPLAGELKWLAGVLGPVRDLDVLIEHLTHEVASLGEDSQFAEPILAGLARERKASRRKLTGALNSERYLGLLDTFAEAVAGLQGEEVQGGLRQLAAVEFRKLRKAAEKMPPDSSDQRVHALRIRAKRARYAAELVAGSELGPYVEALKLVQDFIGEHQDAVVAEEKIRGAVSEETALAAGRLIERERARKLARRADYPAVVSNALRRGRRAFD